MFALLCFVRAVVVLRFKARSRLEAENAVLRHQLIVLRRKVQGRVPLTNTGRWFFIQLYRWFPSILAGACGRSSRHAGALAPVRLSSLLALGEPMKMALFWAAATVPATMTSWPPPPP